MLKGRVDSVEVGGRKLLSSNTFIIPKGEVCDLKLNVSDDDSYSYTFPIRICFDDDGSSTQSVSFTPDTSSNSMKMTLHNWSNPLGSALKEFYPIANIENKTTIDMLMVNRRLGDVNELVVQFWEKVLVP
ncbi:DUF6864 domain-containing function [Escherichia coli]|uniref:DUF6864 domain-containing function n=1 Tax=Escherichia coli TaxID=562 RepID=UPI000944C539|nr:hypothetical protein [Escherichia coli]EGO4446935.1 hypothetical protein [Escherichia coli]MBB6918214.1 hypothetical protein [Escherichia coli]CAD5734774.1 Uncharacterised protein [Escherichia coli]CAD5735143.1 Uncharacterised protein [Escherichia coli]HAX2840299.1 hypothetical protein [Escherichia coli]